MINNLLLGLVENILGKGELRSKGNYAFNCFNPKCPSHGKGTKKLEVNLIVTTDKKNKWACWVCETRGTTIKTLLSATKTQNKYDELNNILGTSYKVKPEELIEEIKVELPKEFKPFLELKKSDLKGRQALNYLLKNRGITFEDIIKHNIGYCEYGKYSNKIIIPSYSKEGKMEYFVARSFIEDAPHPIDAPRSDKNIIGFESLINFDLPIIICEGPFDAISIKRNAIPLFGKNISLKLKNKLMLNSVKSIYLSLDEDALKKTIRVAEELINLGKKLYVVRLQDKDPSKIGFENYNKLIQSLKPFTYSDLIKLKMEI